MSALLKPVSINSKLVPDGRAQLKTIYKLWHSATTTASVRLSISSSPVLRPYMEREFEAQLGPKWPTEVLERMPEHAQERSVRTGEFDVALMLNSMWHNWNEVFKSTLGHEERSLVAELRSVRNRWAHQETFSTDDTYRALDSMERLLRAVSAPEASDIEKSKTVVLRTRFEKQAQYQATRAGTSTVDGTPVAGLLPWREIITPHPDVARGSFQQAEFAADLDKVFRGQASSEYNDPSQFFARTLPHQRPEESVGFGAQATERRGRRSGCRIADQLRRRQNAFDAGALSSVFGHQSGGAAWCRRDSRRRRDGATARR